MAQHIFEPAIFKVNTASGSGTSFYLKDKNIFVTNYHVVGAYKQVSLQDMSGTRYLAHVVLANPHEDVAFLRTVEDFDHLPQLDLHGDDGLSQGDKVYVAGYPFGMPFTVTEGIISAPNQLMDGKQYIQTDAAVNPGNSGGPMINQHGKIIGITTSKLNNADNMGFAVPATMLVEEFDALKNVIGHSFNMICGSCSAMISERSEYCNNCGQGIDTKYYDEPLLTDLGVFCENAIESIGINPVLTRHGQEYWQFYVGSSLVRMFVYNQGYLYATSPINQLPTQNMSALLDELLSKDVSPYQLGVFQNEIFVSYRVHMSNIFSPHQENIKKNVAGLFTKANELDDYFVEKFGCKFSTHSLKMKAK